MSGFAIFYQWRTALAGQNGEVYYFPDRFTLFFRKKYSISGVYRWRVMRDPGEAKETVYIGEAEDVVRRIQRVRTPSREAKAGDTNRRLHEIFEKHLTEERKIVLDLADVEPFAIAGVRFGRDTMGDPFKRKAVENILLALEQASGKYELLNIALDPVEKAREALARLPPHVVREILKRRSLSK